MTSGAGLRFRPTQRTWAKRADAVLDGSQGRRTTVNTIGASGLAKHSDDTHAAHGRGHHVTGNMKGDMTPYVITRTTCISSSWTHVTSADARDRRGRATKAMSVAAWHGPPCHSQQARALCRYERRHDTTCCHPRSMHALAMDTRDPTRTLRTRNDSHDGAARHGHHVPVNSQGQPVGRKGDMTPSATTARSMQDLECPNHIHARNTTTRQSDVFAARSGRNDSNALIERWCISPGAVVTSVSKVSGRILVSERNRRKRMRDLQIL
jgi:hypothetical protein